MFKPFTGLATRFVAFFALEKFLLHHHGFSENDLQADHDDEPRNRVRPMVWINLFDDAINNFVDGVTIAVTFLIYPTLGVTTVLATILPEVLPRSAILPC